MLARTLNQRLDSLRTLVAVRHRPRRRRITIVIMALLVLTGTFAGLSAARAVLYPRIDSPGRVDGIVVVAGIVDDRYDYARQLAEDGIADHILVSRPASLSGSYARKLDSFCASDPVTVSDGRVVHIECFSPDVGTTEGEAAAGTRIAHSLGWESLLVVTYWGHVSRVRIYFEQCFNGSVFVIDTPQPLSTSRRDAILHETGGYVKAFLKPAC